MKFSAYKNKDYTFQATLFTFTTTTDSQGGETLHFSENREISLIVVTGIFGKMTCFFQDTEADIQLKDQLWNLRDASGLEMNPGYIWTIDQFAPYINAWGRREGFKGRISFEGLVSST